MFSALDVRRKSEMKKLSEREKEKIRIESDGKRGRMEMLMTMTTRGGERREKRIHYGE